MGSSKDFLVTLVNGSSLLKVAIRFTNGLTREEEDAMTYWAEPVNQEWIKSKLPAHVASVGPIVEVEDLFDISVV